MTPEKLPETTEPAATLPQPRRRLIRRIPALVWAVYYSMAGVTLASQLFSTETASAWQRVLLIELVGFMLVLAVIHVVIFRLGRSSLEHGLALPRR